MYQLPQTNHQNFYFDIFIDMHHGINFINKSSVIHNNIYDYSLVNYVNNSTKINIKCNLHGIFSQMPLNHVRGSGCPKCARNKNSDKLKLSVFTLLNQFNKRHGNLYDYSLVNYINDETPINIICKEHGQFNQIPSHHKNGSGCPKCKKVYRKTTEEFITEAIKIHNDKYNYSLVKYKNNHSKIKILCNKHDIFLQEPQHHLNGSGCPKCNRLGGVKERKLFNNIKDEFPNLNIISQGIPKWLKTTKCNTQSLDIYLPDYNIAIEYQGIQHFESKKVFGGDKGLNKIIRYDERKMNLCIQNNVQLFYFTYDNSYVPKDYKYKIYTNEEELIKNIKKHLEL